MTQEPTSEIQAAQKALRHLTRWLSHAADCPRYQSPGEWCATLAFHAECVCGLQHAYEAVEKALAAVSSPDNETPQTAPALGGLTRADIEWLSEYCLNSAVAADQEFCVGAAEHEKANTDFRRAGRIFDLLLKEVYL